MSTISLGDSEAFRVGTFLLNWLFGIANEYSGDLDTAVSKVFQNQNLHDEDFDFETALISKSPDYSSVIPNNQFNKKVPTLNASKSPNKIIIEV